MRQKLRILGPNKKTSFFLMKFFNIYYSADSDVSSVSGAS